MTVGAVVPVPSLLKPTLEAEIPQAPLVFAAQRRTLPRRPRQCSARSQAIVTAQWQTVPAHTPSHGPNGQSASGHAQTTISLRGKFSGESMHMDEHSQVTTIWRRRQGS
jgi:hypothetical protein